jgi:IclR family acetate operon transcriptional repressor
MVTDVPEKLNPLAARSGGAQTVEKAMRVLLAVADQTEPISLVALSRAAGLEKTATHRMATSLVRYGMLHYDPETRAYSLGLRLVDLGQRALARVDVVHHARPHLERLGELSGEAVHLGVFEEGQVVFVGQVTSPQPVVIRARVGSRVPAHCTAMGKVLLAFGPPSRMEQVRERHGLPQLTPNTITDPDDVAEHLARVRRLGYALDDEEHRVGVRCVGAPVLDDFGAALAAISITGPAFRFSRTQIDTLVEPLLAASVDLSAALGYQTGSLRDGEPR